MTSIAGKVEQARATHLQRLQAQAQEAIEQFIEEITKRKNSVFRAGASTPVRGRTSYRPIAWDVSPRFRWDAARVRISENAELLIAQPRTGVALFGGMFERFKVIPVGEMTEETCRYLIQNLPTFAQQC